ncbi:MAG: toxin-antitoxin system HicB family antitoxin [Pyrinomonadaceae bacterium]
MSTLENIVVPESLLRQVRALADKEGITLDQFIASAMAEKAAAWMTVDYLEKRAASGSREKFLQVLAKVPDAEPDEEDRLQ